MGNGGDDAAGGSNTSQSREDSASLSPPVLLPDDNTNQRMSDPATSSSDALLDQAILATTPSIPSDLFGRSFNVHQPQPSSPSAAFNEAFWTDQSLDAILSATLPTFDLAMYGQSDVADPLEAFRFSPAFDFEMGDANVEPVRDVGSDGMSGAQIIEHDPPSPISEVNATLSEFYEQYILPAWTVTYPPKLRGAVTARYKDVTKHQINKLCRHAAAAVYLNMIRRKVRHQQIWVGYQGHPLRDFPQRYMVLDIDSESLVRDATLLVRSPRDVNLTMEAHFWALSDLHMAVGAACDSTKAFAIADLAERLMSITYGNHPPIDFLSLSSFPPFYVRAFAMIDLNRSICQRRPTFYNFVEVASFGETPHINDGSHDQWFGLPAGLALWLSRLTNLIARLRDPLIALSPLEISAQATQIERYLSSYRCPFASSDVDFDRHPREWAPEILVETEIWRNIGLLLLWRHVTNDSPLAAHFRDCVSLLLNLIRSLEYLTVSRTASENNVIDFWTLNYTAPAFLVGSVLMDREQRKFIKSFLERIGAEKNLEDMVVALETTWSATDRSGGVADWFEECKRLDLSVVFF